MLWPHAALDVWPDAAAAILGYEQKLYMYVQGDLVADDGDMCEMLEKKRNANVMYAARQAGMRCRQYIAPNSDAKRWCCVNG